MECEKSLNSQPRSRQKSKTAKPYGRGMRLGQLDDRTFDKQLLDWINQIRETAACECAALYLLTEPGGKSLHLISVVCGDEGRPPFPARLQLSGMDSGRPLENGVIPAHHLSLPFIGFNSLESLRSPLGRYGGGDRDRHG